MFQALMFALFILSGSQAFSMSYSIQKALTPAGKQINVVRMTGEIANGEWALWKGMVASLDTRKDTLFILQSPGGNAAHGLFMLQHVEEFLESQRTAGHQVSVLAVKDCSSMCVPLFYAFENRLSYPDTRIGLHAVHDEMGTNTEFTQNYLKRLRAIAIGRGDRDMLRWLSEKERAGAFASVELDKNRAEDLALEHSGIIVEEGLVENEKKAIERFESVPDVRGPDISWTHPGYKALIAKIWNFVSRDLAGIDPTEVLPPVLHLEPFERDRQSPAFTEWQSEWIINHAKVWLEWTEVKGVPISQITPDWVRTRIHEIYPFPITFRGFHYDSTNVVQVNPETTFLATVTPDLHRTSFRDYVGYGYYVTGHEFAHYALGKRGIPDKLHHCIYLLSVNGKPSLMRRLNDYLVQEGIGGALLSRYGLEQEMALNACQYLSPEDKMKAIQYAREI